MKTTLSMLCLVPLIFLLPAYGNSLQNTSYLHLETDARPPIASEVHNLGNLWNCFWNIGRFGDPDANSSSMEWPGGSGSYYLWEGGVWSCCFGEVTSTYPDSAIKWASCADYGQYEFAPSDGFPMEKLVPGPVADEQTQYGFDDWDLASNSDPYGIAVWEENYGWTDPGYTDFIITSLAFTHHNEFGSGNPLGAFVPSVRGDCDVATSDEIEAGIDDMVYYDGHAIWANGIHDFEYVFTDLTNASEQDDYIYQQNPDSPLPVSDPQNIFYHYNYLGSDGIPDNDVDQNGVSDHFTIICKVVGTDTLYNTDPASGVELFSAGRPYFCYTHVVADTTYLVVPRNLSYMWDGDALSTVDDDSGEQELSVPCNGFVGWRLLDMYVVKADKSIERPGDVYGYTIPLSHTWWNWEQDPGTDTEKYDYMWGLNPDLSGWRSGPEYLGDWVGNPDAPEAMSFVNPGPFPVVHDSPLNLGYPVFDYRFLISMAPVDLADGDSLYVVGGWVMGLGLDGLRANADLMLDAYHRNIALGIEEAADRSDNSLRVSQNPVSALSLSLSFTIAEPAHASLEVYDAAGRIVQRSELGEMNAGQNTVSVNSGSLSNGLYFALVRTPNCSSRGRFVVLR